MSDGPIQPAPPSPLDLPSAADRDRRLAITLSVLLMALFATVGTSVQLCSVAFGIWFTELFLFLGVTAVMLRWTGRDPWRYPDVDGGKWPLFAYGFVLGAINLFALGIPLQFTAQQLSPEEWRRTFDAANLFRNQSTVELVVIAAAAVIAAPICEEYFFRGVLLKGLAARHGELRALFVSSLVFSVFHLDPVGLVARTELGMLFGYLYLRTRSLWPGVAAHAANNAVSLSAYFLSRDRDQTADPGGAEAWGAVGLMVLFGVPLLYAAWRFGRDRGLLERRPPSAPLVPLPPVPLSRLAAPWAAAAAVSLGLLFALDHRGVRLNLIDAQRPVRELAGEERDHLKALRARARRGEAPLEEYQRAREALRRAPPSG